MPPASEHATQDNRGNGMKMTGHWATVGDEVYHRKKKLYGRVLQIRGGVQTNRMQVLWENRVTSWVRRNQVRILGYPKSH